jgi:hypothetical protein
MVDDRARVLQVSSTVEVSGKPQSSAADGRLAQHAGVASSKRPQTWRFASLSSITFNMNVWLIHKSILIILTYPASQQSLSGYMHLITMYTHFLVLTLPIQHYAHTCALELASADLFRQIHTHVHCVHQGMTYPIDLYILNISTLQ